MLILRSLKTLNQQTFFQNFFYCFNRFHYFSVFITQYFYYTFIYRFLFTVQSIEVLFVDLFAYESSNKHFSCKVTHTINRLIKVSRYIVMLPIHSANSLGKNVLCALRCVRFFLYLQSLNNYNVSL